MNGFGFPAAFNELLGEEVEQFRMGGKVPFESKVIRCANNSLAKVLLPNTVDGDPGGKGVVGMGEVFRQLQAAILDLLLGVVCASRAGIIDTNPGPTSGPGRLGSPF